MSLENVIITVSRKDKQLEKFAGNFPNLRTLKGFLSGEWDLSIFDECFKGANRLGDVDASVELNGHTLHVEFKGNTGGMNKGQVLKAIRQAKYTGIVTIFVFGKQNKPEGYLKIVPMDNELGYESSGYRHANLELVQDQFLRWASWTEKNSLVTGKTEEWNQVNEVLSSVWNAQKIL